jgi:hypothetical protein
MKKVNNHNTYLIKEKYFKSFDNEIDYLKHLHYAFRIFLDKKNYSVVNNMMNAFDENSDKNEINTILIITNSFKNQPELKDNIIRLNEILKF